MFFLSFSYWCLQDIFRIQSISEIEIDGCAYSILSALAAFISIGDWQYFKRTGLKPSETVEETSEVKLESAQVRTYDVSPKVTRPKESRTRSSGSRDHRTRDTRDNRQYR